MKLPRTTLPRALSALVLVASASAALTWSHESRPSANEGLELAMGQINQSMKILGKGLTAENREGSLAELEKIQQAILAAKVLTPDTAEAVAESERTSFVAEYRTSLLEALKLTCDAEIALLQGKYEDATAILRGRLGALKSSAHDKFKGEDH